MSCSLDPFFCTLRAPCALFHLYTVLLLFTDQKKKTGVGVLFYEKGSSKQTFIPKLMRDPRLEIQGTGNMQKVLMFPFHN